MVSEDIVVRNPKLEWDAAASRFWFGGSAIRSNWMNALSTTFPAVERLFIEAVRHYQADLADPALRERAAKFVAQEGAHAREHRRFNELLERQGYPVERAEARAKKVMEHVRRSYGPRTWLAVTCALEHFTTILCTEGLRNPLFHEPMRGEYLRLWAWHCLEELEHKSVAFDVFLATGGTYRKRAITMLHATLVMWPLLGSIIVTYQAHDRKLLSPREWWTGLMWSWIWPGLLRRIAPSWLAYFRRDYHPSQNPDDGLIALWRARLGAGAGTAELDAG